MPIATVIFTVPGLPMIYSGQEVGYGIGIGNYDQRRRGVINWNAGGKGLLMPHYHKLAHIRAQLKAFSSQQFNRIASGNGWVYAYARPDSTAPAVVLTNFTGTQQTVTIPLTEALLGRSFADGIGYFASDVYADTSASIQFSGGSSNLSVTLPSYGSGVFVVADSVVHLTLPPLVTVEELPVVSGMPGSFELRQNYPNPFNSQTTISFDVPEHANVSVRIYNILGELVRTLVNKDYGPGTYTVRWDGTNESGSVSSTGVYFMRMEAGSAVRVRKALLLK